MKRALLYGVAAVAGLGLAMYLARKAPTVGGLASGLASGAVDAVHGAAVGTVEGIGSVFGIPKTSVSQCDADLAAGRTWDASFSCPAARFVGSVFNSSNINTAAVNDLRQVDRAMERQAATYAAMDAYYAGAPTWPDDGRTGTW